MNQAFWIERCQQLEARISDREQEIKEIKKQLEDAYNHAKTLEGERKTLKREVESLNTKLEAQEKNENTLACIGAAVRVRFLEQAKSQVMGIFPRQFNTRFIQQGNDAAHRANGAVDAAILTGNYLNDNEKKQLKKVFGLIYDNATPQNYGNLPPKLLRAIDHQGSIISLYALNNGSMSIKDRQAAGDSMQYLKDKHSELEDDLFEKNEDVARHLKRLGELADLIIAKSRRQGVRESDGISGASPTSYGPPYRPSTVQTSPARKESASRHQSHRGRGAPRENHPSI